MINDTSDFLTRGQDTMTNESPCKICGYTENDLKKNIGTIVAHLKNKPDVVLVKPDTIGSDVQKALDALFHYHGYTSHHVSEVTQKSIWFSLKIIERALTQLTKQPKNVTCGEVSNADVKQILEDLDWVLDKHGVYNHSDTKLVDFEDSECAGQTEYEYYTKNIKQRVERALTAKQKPERPYVVGDDGVMRQVEPVNQELLGALKGVVFQDSNISEDEKLKRYVFARQAIEHAEQKGGV